MLQTSCIYLGLITPSCDPMNYTVHGILQDTGVGSPSFLQGIFPTQRSNPGLLHYRWILYQLSHKKENGTAEDEMVGWYHELNGREFNQAPGVGNGQGSLTCCSPWGFKESDMTEQLHSALIRHS